MSIEGINNANKEDLVAHQVNATEARKASATQQAEEAAKKYHNKLDAETVEERTNAQTLTSIIAEKGRV